MGPTIDVKTESMPVEMIAEIIIDTFDSDASLASSLSDTDSSVDDLFLSLYDDGSSAKENRPVYLRDDDLGGDYKFKVTSSGRGEDSYQRRRQRNNAAVKRSRDKARQRQRDSQRHLAELTAENRRLQLKADVLLKELSLLRGLFPAVDPAAPPSLLENVDAMLADSQ